MSMFTDYALATTVLVLACTGCSGSQEEGQAAAPSTPVVASPSTPPAPTVTPTAASPTPRAAPSKTPPVLDPRSVLLAFMKAGLPVNDFRDNSQNCVSLQLGCDEQWTTDDVTVMSFRESAAQRKLVAAYGKDAASRGPYVLSYLAARTPAELRPKYEAALRKFLAQR